MKKILSILVLALFVISLSACTEPEDDDNTNNNNNNDDPKTDVPDDIGDPPSDMVDTSENLKNDVDVCYQIFPISYADSNDDGKGDLRGIADNVDYLSETLDVDCVWLNPINPSPSYHKYNITDYYGIDSEFGTMEDFEHFIETMHDNGILVLMDFVINHTDFNHPWFKESRAGDEEYRDWYMWHDFDNSDADYPSMDGWYRNGDSYYFASFWDQMPELNFQHEPVREEIKDIATYWLEKGVDGFRIDAARHIHDRKEYPRGTDYREMNVNWFLEFNDHIKSVNEDAIMLSEIWLNSSAVIGEYYQGMDTTFNFMNAENILEAVQTTSKNTLVSDLVEAHEDYGENREDFVDSIFITNHDQPRVMTEFDHDEAKAKLAANMLFTLPGVSWVYYGEEIGMDGGKPDERIRQPFKWSSDSEYNAEGQPGGIQDWNDHNQSIDGVEGQLDDDRSLLNHYRELISLKKSHAVLSDGDLEEVDTSENDVIAYTRSDGDTTYLVVHHLGNSESTIDHALSDHEVLWSAHEANAVGENAFTMAAQSTLVIDVSDSDDLMD
ncbi:MAG: alpha-amylase family glycosyl hydrolase [Bacillota bacterium]